VLFLPAVARTPPRPVGFLPWRSPIRARQSLHAQVLTDDTYARCTSSGDVFCLREGHPALRPGLSTLRQEALRLPRLLLCRLDESRPAISGVCCSRRSQKFPTSGVPVRMPDGPPWRRDLIAATDHSTLCSRRLVFVRAFRGIVAIWVRDKYADDAVPRRLAEARPRAQIRKVDAEW